MAAICDGFASRGPLGKNIIDVKHPASGGLDET